MPLTYLCSSDLAVVRLGLPLRAQLLTGLGYSIV